MVHQTLRKFGYPESLIHEGEHWALLLRPAQPTLGALVLCAKSDAHAYGDLPDAAFAEQAATVRLAERILKQVTDYQRINYLMLMMVDPHVHFHVLPRYEGERSFGDIAIGDAGWPGLPALAEAVPPPPGLLDELRRLASQ